MWEQAATGVMCRRMVWQPQNWKLKEWVWLGQLQSLYSWSVKMWQDQRSQGRGQGPHCSAGLRPNGLPHHLFLWPLLDGTVLAPCQLLMTRKPDLLGCRLGSVQVCVALLLVSLTSEVAVCDCQPWGYCWSDVLLPCVIQDGGLSVIRKQWLLGDEKTSRNFSVCKWEKP